MYQHTKGILLKTIDYNDTSLIVKVYTEVFGLQSYLVSGTRSKKSSVKINLFQPLNLLDMVVTKSPKYQIQRIKELKIDEPFLTITNNIAKSSITFFINEILYKSIKEEEPNEALFYFIRNSLLYLDLHSDNSSNFHLMFLVHLSKHLGFCPSQRGGNTNYFNLKDGVFQENEPIHPYFLSQGQTNLFAELMKSNYERLSFFSISNAERRDLLNKLVQFFELHLNNNNSITSHLILEEVIS